MKYQDRIVHLIRHLMTRIRGSSEWAWADIHPYEYPREAIFFLMRPTRDELREARDRFEAEEPTESLFG